MSLTGRVTATRGALIKLKTNLKLVTDGKNILKVKRDRLVGELNNLIKEFDRRKKLENRLTGVYEDFKEATANLGYEHVASTSLSIPKIKIQVRPISIMGVIVPKITVKEKPRTDSIEDMELYKIANDMRELIDELLHVAQIETEIERIANELLRINRKVNALERVIIPSAEKQVRYIEELLLDEDLEEFSRTKHVRNVIGREKV
jgi:V/A-type H+/Na+-transporting ATPase subunit D